jgi:hypothetical protein
MPPPTPNCAWSATRCPAEIDDGTLALSNDIGYVLPVKKAVRSAEGVGVDDDVTVLLDVI